MYILLTAKPIKFYIHYFILFLFMNIYIGNLSYRLKEKDLEQVLGEYGAVSSVKIITDRESGRSKGFGFAEMENDEEAEKAIKELNGAELDGRAMVLKVALPKN